jgi:hypothetical protein
MQEKTTTKQNILAASAIILLGAVSRFIPHPFNFTPIGAMALFGGASINRKQFAFIIPVAALLISNCLFELQSAGSGFNAQLIWVYGSMLLITGMGLLLRNRDHKQSLLLASLTGSVLFFLITNFGVWFAGFYGAGFSGLMNCYVAGVPFFGGTLVGDLFYNAVFFGAFALYERRITKVIL